MSRIENLLAVIEAQQHQIEQQKIAMLFLTISFLLTVVIAIYVLLYFVEQSKSKETHDHAE